MPTLVTAQPLRQRAPKTALQRKCACGGGHREEGECPDCGKKRLLQRKAATGTRPGAVPPIVNEVLQSSGQPLDEATRGYMESGFGHDFSRVRVHTDTKAAESACSVNALAYTIGSDIAFGQGQYAPHSQTGLRLLAHELTHVVQQGTTSYETTESQPHLERFSGDNYRIAVAPTVSPDREPQEHEADAVAAQVVRDFASPPAVIERRPSAADNLRPQLQRARVPLPGSVPLCGRTLTHVDVEPPRWRPLLPCLPRTVLVNRINIVGRDLSVPTVGRGPQVFNLHIGYYRDPATGRLCVIADDSKTCVAPRCVFLGCFPTLREVLDAIINFLKAALIVLGIVALAILIALILEALAPVFAPAAALAEAEPGSAPAGTGELASRTSPPLPGGGRSAAASDVGSEGEG